MICLISTALIEEIYEWVKDDNMRLPRHLLRFNAHLILFLRTVGVCTKVGYQCTKSLIVC